MSFKKTEPHFSFADIALFNSMDRNRAIKKMEKINTVVTRMIRNAMDALFRQLAFNLSRGTKVVKTA